MIEKNELAIKRFEARMIARGLQDKTKERYLEQVKHFLKYTKKPYDEITLYDVDNYVLYKTKEEKKRHQLAKMSGKKGLGREIGRIANQEGKLSYRTINLFYSTFRQFMKINQKAGIANQVINARGEKWKPKIEEEEILKTINFELVKEFYETKIKNKNVDFYMQRDFLLLLFIASTGARIGECQKVKHQDLKLHWKIPKVTLYGKGKHRDVELDPLWIKLYKKTKQPNTEHVFTSLSGARLSVGTMKNIIKNITGYSPHKFRHLYAIIQTKRGTKMDKLQEALGHEDMGTTGIYLKLIKNKNEQIGTPLSSILKKR